VSVVDLVATLDALLPQTQCARCGYDGCRPYAEALARGEARANRCVPGGQETAHALSSALGVPALALDLGGGASAAWCLVAVDEAACIGCTLCLDACPVDAIVGARKLTHTVLGDVCTGCELCLAACPVDCIEAGAACEAEAGGGVGVVRAGEPGFVAAWNASRAPAARLRSDRRRARLARTGSRRRRSAPGASRLPSAAGVAERQAVIAAAVARSRARRARHCET
jgi:electron transport complex protein RnfB